VGPQELCLPIPSRAASGPDSLITTATALPVIEEVVPSQTHGAQRGCRSVLPKSAGLSAHHRTGSLIPYATNHTPRLPCCRRSPLLVAPSVCEQAAGAVSKTWRTRPRASTLASRTPNITGRRQTSSGCARHKAVTGGSTSFAKSASVTKPESLQYKLGSAASGASGVPIQGIPPRPNGGLG